METYTRVRGYGPQIHIRVWVYGPRIWPVPPETTVAGQEGCSAASPHTSSILMEMASARPSEGRQCAGPRLFRGATSCLDPMPTLWGSRLPWEDPSNPWLSGSDGSSLQPPDRWDYPCQPSSCPDTMLRTLSRTGYIEDPDWSHQLPRQRTFPDNSDIHQHCYSLHFLCSGLNGQYFLVLRHVAGSIIGPVIRI